MLYTKEMQDVMSMFEKYAKKEVRCGSVGLLREPRENWPRQYYCDGNVNEAFRHYLNGYALGKALFQNPG